MGPGLKFLTQVGSVNILLLGSAIFGLGLGLENFPKKYQIFSLSGQKKSLRVVSKSTDVKGDCQPLIYCRSKVCSGRVKAHLYYDHITIR